MKFLPIYSIHYHKYFYIAIIKGLPVGGSALRSIFIFWSGSCLWKRDQGRATFIPDILEITTILTGTSPILLCQSRDV